MAGVVNTCVFCSGDFYDEACLSSCCPGCGKENWMPNMRRRRRSTSEVDGKQLTKEEIEAVRTLRKTVCDRNGHVTVDTKAPNGAGFHYCENCEYISIGRSW